MSIEHFDVLIVGAGLSGIGAGYHLQTDCPNKSLRDPRGARIAWAEPGTSSAIPGVRSDSDMYTLGYSFRPWEDAKAIADGPSILSYIRQTAEDYGIDQKIRFGHRVKRASWSTADAQVDGGSGARGLEGDGAPHLQLPVPVQRLLRLHRRLHAGVRGQRALHGPYRAPAEVDRRHRVRRQARRRDRQRRNRGDARAGAGEDGGARHDAAALAELHPLRCPSGTRSPTACARFLPASVAYGDHALEERVARHVVLHAVQRMLRSWSRS